MRQWKAAARDRLQPDPGDGGDSADGEPGEVFASKTLDGRMVLNGDLDPDTAEAFETALRLADCGDPEHPARATALPGGSAPCRSSSSTTIAHRPRSRSRGGGRLARM